MKDDFIKALYAGAMIAMGGACFIKVGGVVGSLLFSIGLIIVCACNLNLFTGKVLFSNSPKLLSLVWFGNLVGCVLIGLMCRFSGFTFDVSKKLAESPIQTILLAIGCNIFIGVAVYGYKKTNSLIPIILGVMGFINCGFEHCVANMFYFTVACDKNIIGSIVLFLIYNTIGNIIGGVFIRPIYGKQD